MKKLDVRKNDTVVVYDKVGMLSSPRAFWLLKLFGLPNVHLLNGTFAKWETEKRAKEEGDQPSAWKKLNRKTKPEASDFQFSYNSSSVRLYDEMVKISNENLSGVKKLPILDSRFTHVYNNGHIPSSVSLPFTSVLNEDKTFKSTEELIKIFK